MKIVVKAFATLREFMPTETMLDIPAGTSFAGLLVVLDTRNPGLHEELRTPDGCLKPFVNILKNGRNILHLEGLATIVEDGDLIALFPPAAGG